MTRWAEVAEKLEMTYESFILFSLFLREVNDTGSHNVAQIVTQASLVLIAVLSSQPFKYLDYRC